MRTTLDIDDRLLSIARVRAREQDISLGKAVSELIERGLNTPPTFEVSKSGFPVFHAPPGSPVVTDDLVARYRDEDA